MEGILQDYESAPISCCGHLASLLPYGHRRHHFLNGGFCKKRRQLLLGTVSYQIPISNIHRCRHYFTRTKNRAVTRKPTSSTTEMPVQSIFVFLVMLSFASAKLNTPSPGEIVGIAVSTLSSSVFINVENRGLFAYSIINGKLLWSAGPVLFQYGYRLGCRQGVENWYFASVPVIDQCETTLYISNMKGEVYSLSLRDPRLNWVQDLSFLDEAFTITPGNNGRLYVTIPVKAILLALDVFTGSILWQQRWISIGSLDGFLYSISPAGTIKKFAKAPSSDSVIQVLPFVDCSGYAVYILQAQVEGKANHLIRDYNYVAAMKPTGVTFTLLVPATGTVYWSESYPVEKLVSTCSQANPKPVLDYPGNRKSLLLFLLFESIVLVILGGLVRFCCIFWNKEKIQGQHLGSFLHKRRSLQQKKKALDRIITELHQKATEEEETGHQAMEEIGDLLRKRDNLEGKLATTYSLGRDDSGRMSIESSKNPKTSLPTTYNGGAASSYSFQSGKNESVTIFHAATYDTSPSAEADEESFSSWTTEEEQYSYQPDAKGKGKAADYLEIESSGSDDDDPTKLNQKYQRCLSELGSSSKGLVRPVVESVSPPGSGRRSMSL